jgi:hypothetical protein
METLSSVLELFPGGIPMWKTEENLLKAKNLYHASALSVFCFHLPNKQPEHQDQPALSQGLLEPARA